MKTASAGEKWSAVLLHLTMRRELQCKISGAMNIFYFVKKIFLVNPALNDDQDPYANVCMHTKAYQNGPLLAHYFILIAAINFCI